MKTVVLLILLCISAYGEDSLTTNVVGDITTKISERTDKNGKPRLHIETSYRGKKRILQVMIRADTQGKMTLASRAYCAGGKTAMVEADDDGDGTFEHIEVLLPGTDDFEMFTRQPDGSVKPVSTKEIELTKKEEAVVDKSIERLFQKTALSDEDAGKILEENWRKLQDLQKQENDVAATNVAHDIRTKISERQGKDGKPDLRVESFYRGKAKILQVVSRRNNQDKMVVGSRTYSVGGKSIATEGDEDGDGVFESLMLHSPDTDDLEIFKRHADGTVEPESTAEIKLVKKTTALAMEPLKKGIQNPNMSDEEISKSLEEARQKIQQLHQQQKDGEKPNGPSPR
jgi:hypothetical protein